MSMSTVFDWLCENVEAVTDLDRLEARGTVRIALKRAGLEAGALTAEQVTVVLDKVMPGELEARGITNGASVCDELAGRVKDMPAADTEDGATTPEDFLARLR